MPTKDERGDLESKLAEIKENIKKLEKELKSMETNGTVTDHSEMRQILDQEYSLNSATSPISATDPNRRNEYESWVRAVETSKRATQDLKEDLQRRIDAKNAEVAKLMGEQRDIEAQLQREQ